jgi:hypothetical protein
MVKQSQRYYHWMDEEPPEITKRVKTARPSLTVASETRRLGETKLVVKFERARLDHHGARLLARAIGVRNNAGQDSVQDAVDTGLNAKPKFRAASARRGNICLDISPHRTSG